VGGVGTSEVRLVAVVNDFFVLVEHTNTLICCHLSGEQEGNEIDDPKDAIDGLRRVVSELMANTFTYSNMCAYGDVRGGNIMVQAHRRTYSDW
jgi:hypothetical protein